MSFSASKSNLKKPSSSTPKTNSVQPRKQLNPTHKVGPRRSKSVSSFSRTHLDITSDFDNTRDNPLFSADGSDSFDQFDPLSSKFVDFSGNSGDIRRGRSVTRNSGGGSSGGGGGTGSLRRRSPFQGPNCGNYENGRKQESSLPSNFRSISKTGLNRNQSLLEGKNKLVRSASDLSEILKGSNTWSSQHPVFETSEDSAISVTSEYDDETLTRPISEVEERTFKPVSEESKAVLWEDDNDTGGAILETVRTEVRRAIFDMHKDLKDAMQKSDSEVIADSMFSDVAPDLEISQALELVKDFKEEFTKELEECEERTRKLRAELAVEEHRELELNKILSDMIPEPETPQVQKPRLIRKGSTERRKMSKRLEEEAMAYFDECVSISTFDDSDFSSLEDPPSHKAKIGETSDVPGVPDRNSISWSVECQDMRQSSCMNHNEASNLSTSAISNNSCRSSLDCLSRRRRFSFASKLPDEQGIRKLASYFSKDKQEEEPGKSHVVRLRAVPQSSERYDSEIPVETFLLDKITFRKRIESGGMVLCSGGIGFPRAPFPSNFW
ncbi:uncharacterized protein LOC141647889 isoform X1 [Silene latifolia]|uniref:uncharacterized protein LOC141647889 isoform X1 n=1 Tax=Silene latifolia TaxID=37657 RepID=UPI003D77F90E